MRRKPARRRGPYKRREGPDYEPCGECSNGWIVVGDAVKRCWCWACHQEKLDLIQMEKAS